MVPKILTRKAFFAFGNRFRWPFGQDIAAAIAALRAQINDPVAGFYDLQIMFDDDHRIALIDQGMEDFQEFFSTLKILRHSAKRDF